MYGPRTGYHKELGNLLARSDAQTLTLQSSARLLLRSQSRLRQPDYVEGGC